jgi:hypothetical protein
MEVLKMKVEKMTRKEFHRLINALAEIAREYRKIENEKQEKEEVKENEN